jgi:hypothetical protein
VKIITILSIFLLFLSCNKDNKKSTNTREMDNDWIKDSLGCLNKRNNDYSEDLIKKYNLTNSNLPDFKMIFGEPNMIEEDSSTTEIFTYFFNSYCDNNNIQNNSDKCYARFYFRNKVLIDRDYICE